MSDAAIGMIALYRWRLHPGQEAAFVDAWAQVTRALRERGSWGSRLHRGDDGLWYGYAQWPDDATRQAAFAVQDPTLTAAQATMQAAIAERFPPTLLTPVADYLVLPHQ